MARATAAKNPQAAERTTEAPGAKMAAAKAIAAKYAGTAIAKAVLGDERQKLGAAAMKTTRVLRRSGQCQEMST